MTIIEHILFILILLNKIQQKDIIEIDHIFRFGYNIIFKNKKLDIFFNLIPYTLLR